MKMLSRLSLGVAIPAFALAAANTSYASSHREAPAIGDDPQADNTDLYAWISADRTMLNIVANWNPLEEPAGGPNFHRFSPSVQYEIHIVRGVSSHNDVLRYFFLFNNSAFPATVPDGTFSPGGGKEFFWQLAGSTQTMTIIKGTRKPTGSYRRTTIGANLSVADTDYGPRSDAVLGRTYNQAYTDSFIHDLGAEGRFWAGPRDDAFYVDLGGVFDLANLRATGVAQDGVAGFNTHAIALEIPLSEILCRPENPPCSVDAGTGLATGDPNDTIIGVWAASSRQSTTYRTQNAPDAISGAYVQVSRLGLPLINEAVIGLQDKDRWNRLYPSSDVPVFGAYFLNPVIVRDAQAVGIYADPGANPGNLSPDDFATNRTDIINVVSLVGLSGLGIPEHTYPGGIGGANNIGDYLRIAPEINAAFPSGRSLEGATLRTEQADVTDVVLSLALFGLQQPVSDGVNYNDVDLLPTFPYLGQPHRGFDGGHGTPTP